jgi:hypothetical protein
LQSIQNMVPTLQVEIQLAWFAPTIAAAYLRNCLLTTDCHSYGLHTDCTKPVGMAFGPADPSCNISGNLSAFVTLVASQIPTHGEDTLHLFGFVGPIGSISIVHKLHKFRSHNANSLLKVYNGNNDPVILRSILKHIADISPTLQHSVLGLSAQSSRLALSQGRNQSSRRIHCTGKADWQSPSCR